MVLVFGADAGTLVSGLRSNGFEVLSAKREDEVTALVEAIPIDAIVVDHSDAGQVYSSLLTVTMLRPGCKRVLIWDEAPPASIAEYVDAGLARPCDVVDLVWTLMG